MPLLAAVTVPALFAAGCSSGDPAPVAAGAAGPTTATASATTESAAAPTTSATPRAAAGTKSPGTDRCHTGQLTVTKGTGGAASGTSSVNLVFTNKSGVGCTLYGFPGVSWVTGDNGTQVNSGFTRDPVVKKVVVDLKSHQVAHAVAFMPAPGSWDAAKCKPVPVRGFRVYPPDETTSIFVSEPSTTCSVKGVGTGHVSAIDAGTGENG